MNIKLRYQDFVNEQRLGKIHAVFIDDTGSPGLQDTPSNLHPDRKTWVAVVVPKTQIAEVWEQFPNALEEVNKLFGVNEFHFTDIYMGRKAFRNVSIDLRLALFRFMAKIFEIYRFPIFVQTLDPKSIEDIRSRRKFPKQVGCFNLQRHEDFALFLLLLRVKWYLEKFYTADNKLARVFVDEGYKKNGIGIRIPSLNKVFVDGTICFARSDTILPLQLADFAAFSLNRSQLIIGKEKPNYRDEELLRILSPIAWNYQNIPKTSTRDLFTL